MAKTKEDKIVSFTMEELRAAGPGRTDWDKVNSFTDEDIERQAIEDEEREDAELIAAGRLADTGPNYARNARKKLGLSQEDFAEKFGLSVRTLQDWEQGHRAPDGPSTILLQVIAEAPAVVIRVVKKSRPVAMKAARLRVAKKASAV